MSTAAPFLDLSTPPRTLVDHVRRIGVMKGYAFEAAQRSKAAVPGATTSDATWASPLIGLDGAREFVALLLRRAVVGMTDFTRTAFATPTPTQTGAAASYWIGEGAAIPLTDAAFASATLDPLKVGSLAVISRELLRSSNPASSARIADQLASAGAAGLNSAFLDPANTGTPGVKPASITAGIALLTPTGSTPADVAADIGSLIDAADGDDANLDRAILVMSPGKAFAAGVGAGDRNCGPRGGTLHGIPVFTTREAGANVVLIDTTGILIALGAVDIADSEHASLEMVTTPSGSAADGTAANVVSMWQSNSSALRILQHANWQRVRDNAVHILG